MSDLIRHHVVKILIPVARAFAAIGAVTQKFHRQEVQAGPYPGENEIQVGDCIVSKTKWVPTNLVIPGKYKHALMYVGGGLVVEATYPSVRIIPLHERLADFSRYAILRPKFLADTEGAATVMSSLVGFPYDVGFTPNEKAFYCSEAVWYSYRKVAAYWDFEPRKRFGTPTVTPNDLYLAKRHFTLIEEVAQ